MSYEDWPHIAEEDEYEPRVVALARHLVTTDDPNLPERTRQAKWLHEGVDFLEQAWRLDNLGYKLP